MAQQVGIEFNAVDKFTPVVKGMGTATNQMFTTITQSAKGMVTETKQVQNVMGATVTTVTKASQATGGFTQSLKNNILSISVAASSIIGLVQQYTQLQRARIMMERAGIAEARANQAVIDKTNQLQAAIFKYGQGSQQAADATNKLKIAQDAAALATERHGLLQESFNERLADFAVNILPNIIGAVGSVIQVIQNWSTATKGIATATTIAGTAEQTLNATRALGIGTTVGLAGATDTLATAEVGAGVAATGMGHSMKAALIGTGVGAILVAIGTALVAFTQNWWGVRDAVNAAGVEIGKLVPILLPVLNVLKQFGDFLLQIFGVTLPASATEGAAVIEGMSKDAIDSMKNINDAWKNTLKDLLVMPDSKHKEWKEQWKKLMDLGFSKKGAHEIKDFVLRPAAFATAITDNISKALQLVGQAGTHFSPSSMRKLSNNLIDQINEGIKKSKGQLDFMGHLSNLLRSHKKDPELPKLVAEWFAGLPEELKKKLKDFGLDPDVIIQTLGFDSTKISEAINKAFDQGLMDAFKGPKIQKGGVEYTWSDPFSVIPEGGKAGDTKVQTKTKGWLADLIENIKNAFSTENLAGIADNLMLGILTVPADVATKVATWLGGVFSEENIKAALKTMGTIATTATGAIMTLITDPIGTATKIGTWLTNVVESIGAWFSGSFPKTTKRLGEIGASIWAAIWAGWEAIKDVGQRIGMWLGKNLTVEGLTEIGKTIWASIWQGWETITDIGTKIAGWLKTNIDAGWEAIKKQGAALAEQVANGFMEWWSQNDPIKKLFPREVPRQTIPNEPQGGTGGGPVITSIAFSKKKGKKTQPLPDIDRQKELEETRRRILELFPNEWQYWMNSNYLNLPEAEIDEQGNIVSGSGSNKTKKAAVPTRGGARGGGSITPSTPIAFPAPDLTKFGDGLNEALKVANDAVSRVNKIFTTIVLGAPDLSPYGEGLNQAFNVAGDAVNRIITTLAKTEVGAPDLSPYGEGLNQAFKVAKDAAKRITKALANTKVGAPDLSDFGGGLNEAIGAAKDAARRINAALSATSIPHAEGGIYSFAEGGITTRGSRQRYGPFTWAERGNETLAFVPHNNPWPILDRLNAMFGAGGNGAEGNLSGQIATLLGSLRIPVTIVLQLPTREIVEEVEVHLGQNIRRF